VNTPPDTPAEHDDSPPVADAGQATVEYALVVLAAATIALLVIAWAARTGKIGQLFDLVFDRVVAGAG